MALAYDARKPTNHYMLKLAREVRGLDKERVVELSGISLTELEQYERKNTVLSKEHLLALAEGYGFPAAFFFREGKCYPPIGWHEIDEEAT